MLYFEVLYIHNCTEHFFEPFLGEFFENVCLEELIQLEFQW